MEKRIIDITNIMIAFLGALREQALEIVFSVLLITLIIYVLSRWYKFVNVTFAKILIISIAVFAFSFFWGFAWSFAPAYQNNFIEIFLTVIAIIINFAILHLFLKKYYGASIKQSIWMTIATIIIPNLVNKLFEAIFSSLI